MNIVDLVRTAKAVNWGWVSSWAGAWLSLASAIRYFFAKDYRRTLYFLFAFGITAVISWK